MPHLLLERGALGRVEDKRWVVSKAPPAIYHFSQFRKHSLDRGRAFLGDDSVDTAVRSIAVHQVQHFLAVDPAIPDVQGTHLRELSHPPTVTPNAGLGGLGALEIGYRDGASGSHDACSQAFNVPFPGAGQRLVK